MLGLKFTTTGIEAAIHEAEAIEVALRDGIMADLHWFGTTATGEMIATHTFQNRTYRLENSIGYRVYPMFGQLAKLDIYALAEYASQVEFGHPTARPYPFFYPVFWSYTPPLWEHLQASLDGALTRERRAA